VSIAQLVGQCIIICRGCGSNLRHPTDPKKNKKYFFHLKISESFVNFIHIEKSVQVKENKKIDLSVFVKYQCIHMQREYIKLHMTILIIVYN